MSKAIIGLVKKHAGEIVEFDKRRTTWRLAQVERRSKGLAELCRLQAQVHWRESGRPLGDVYAAHLTEPFLSEEADQPHAATRRREAPARFRRLKSWR